MKPRLIFLMGPTASGKTEVSLVLARKINCQIISCDSMQIYKGMDILSSKPSRAARKKVKHYLVDFVPLAQEYNVSQYRWLALKKASMILKKGKVPLFVGGSGLYMTMLVDGMFEMPTQNEDVRKRLYHIADKRGSVALYDRLVKVDPVAADKIHPNDTRRIVRALEVYEVSGKPITVLQKTRKSLERDFDIRIFCLDLDRNELYRRINERVYWMLDHGLVREVKKLAKKKLSRTAAAAIGIREIAGYCAGRLSLDQAKSLMQKNTRNYAKRQLTWFRKDKRVQWIRVGVDDNSAAVCKKILKGLK